MQNYGCWGKSYQQAEGKVKNSYRDIDNFVYHKNQMQ